MTLKLKLRNFDSVIYTEEHTQEVRYRYSIEDSPGLLEIYLTIPEDVDPVEYFVLHTKDMYKYNVPIDYNVYHGKWKYTMHLQKDDILSEYYITKYKMW
jgi:hypothetical protein